MPQFDKNDKNTQNVINDVASKIGSDKKTIEDALESGEIQKIVGKLNPNQLNKIQSILNDNEAAQKLLNTPQAQALIKKLNKNK